MTRAHWAVLSAIPVVVAVAALAIIHDSIALDAATIILALPMMWKARRL